MLIEQLQNHSFVNYKKVGERIYPFWGRSPIEHPLPSIDEGKRMIDCTCFVYNLV
jgi:hypothetical protein